jgi:hypothetical protein
MNKDRMYKAGSQSAASLCISSEKREGSYENQGVEVCRVTLRYLGFMMLS